MEERIAIIILGAGASRRLNEPKQLLLFRGKTLIENAIENALTSNLGPVFVVLGCSSDLITKKLKRYKKKINIVNNPEWEKGVGSSIRVGLKEVAKRDPRTYGILITLVDQPLIGTSHLVKMIRSHFTFGKKIIASGYGGSFGVPAFFHKNFFNYIEKLDGDQGAKTIISKLKQDVHIIPNPDAELNINTEEDYKVLQNHS